jgi:hypothetical protein
MSGKCRFCGTDSPPFRCGRCDVAPYCNAACQKSDIRAHKLEGCTPKRNDGNGDAVQSPLPLRDFCGTCNAYRNVKETCPGCYERNYCSHKCRAGDQDTHVGACLQTNESAFGRWVCATNTSICVHLMGSLASQRMERPTIELRVRFAHADDVVDDQKGDEVVPVRVDMYTPDQMWDRWADDTDSLLDMVSDAQCLPTWADWEDETAASSTNGWFAFLHFHDFLPDGREVRQFVTVSFAWSAKTEGARNESAVEIKHASPTQLMEACWPASVKAAARPLPMSPKGAVCGGVHDCPCDSFTVHCGSCEEVWLCGSKGCADAHRARAHVVSPDEEFICSLFRTRNARAAAKRKAH